MPNRPKSPVNARQRLAAPGGHVNRNLAFTGGLLVIGLAIWWSSAGRDATKMLPEVAAESREPAWTDEALHPTAVPHSRTADPVPRADGEAEFQKYVAAKYRYLLADSQRAPRAAQLQAALLERERTAVLINTLRQSGDARESAALPEVQARLAELDRLIGGLLPAAELTAFEVLKDSDIEQFQLDDYAGGISDVAPLSDDDKRSILFTKLVFRQRFRQALESSGLLRADLSAAERRYAFAEASRALREFKDGYLQEVRQYLYDDQQYALLSNYENSEYTAELAKLRGMAGE